VIFSGGDPLTIGNNKLEKMLKAFYEIETVELIRIGSRMPVVNPFRMDDELIALFKEYKPVYLMTHFNHPNELSEDSALALERCVDNGIPIFNQLVLLNGINNHPALIYALSRRLLYLRVKPYYMFQADPSLGTDHLRTSIENSMDIQRQLWGHTSGLAMPTYIVDIPAGGGKTSLTPNFLKEKNNNTWTFEGWDGVSAGYISPETIQSPKVAEDYQQEWLTQL
jgi:lysine 2,3-aminomutase